MKILIYTGLVLLSFSCVSSYRTVTIETATPAQAMLPEAINSLTLMNRSMNDEFRNFDKDSLQRYFYAKNFRVQAMVLDSLAADTTLKVLGDLLFSSGRYDVVIPENRNFIRSEKFHRIPGSLNWEEVRQICEEFNTDALLVLERYNNNISTRSAVHEPGIYGAGYVSASIDSRYDALIKVYDPQQEKVVRELAVSDTISWGDADLTFKELFRRLPSIKECLLQTGVQVALEFDRRLSPSWIREQRIVFPIAKRDASRIDQWVSQSDWESAYEYWVPFSKSGNGNVRSKAYFNMALAGEMMGHVDEALQNARTSLDLQYRAQTERYIRQLERRKTVLKQFEQFAQ